jgi:DNA-directed RNA polymerase subunit N (RpoN/RPB10)
MACFTCGKGFPKDVSSLLKMFKKAYDEKGIERYFYRLGENQPVMIVSKEQFKTIFTKKIKRKLKDGATYAHISEYNPKS